ncbi:MAG: hypothetical protein K0Q43_2665 [Ramlibacter sp.]|jgi:hypothetical protein|nr:hypothetical protein [Ramlibacter sp.]
MMVKQKLTFDKARTFEFSELAAMPRRAIKPTLEYDSKRQPVSERFALCPWGLYHIEVLAS